MPFEHDTRRTADRNPMPADVPASRGRAALRTAGSYAEGAASVQAQDAPAKRSMVFIGMGDYAHDEARHLNKIAPEGVRSIRQKGEQDVWRGQDLTKTEGVEAFVATIAATEAQRALLVEILGDVGGQARDEVAQIFEVFAEAENGERQMERLVLSGHSVGNQIWGDKNGQIDFDTLYRIGQVFPNAVGQVEDLMLSACYTGGEATMDQYFQIFPNVQTIMAYHKSSPGTWSGAMPHMGRWERATRGRNQDQGQMTRDIAKGERKGGNVSVWTATGGYDGAEQKSAYDLLFRVQGMESVFLEYHSGDRVVENPQEGPLRDYYNAIQAALGHPEVDDANREALLQLRDTTIRLIYFHIVREKFAEHYAGTLQSGYEAIGAEVPAYATMTRKQAVDAIQGYLDAGGSGEAARVLNEGLYALDPSVIPETWV